MKKFFTLAVMLMLTLGASAQEKKAWLFYEGLSEETIANLNADAANWASNGTDAEGVTNNWKNAVKQSADSYWMANGQVIEELRGLKIDIGSNKDNSVHLATTKLRLTRKSTKITFPKLANGQKITIQGRSANSTAINRGIAPVQSYIQFQADESSSQTGGACIFLGNQAEGSEGTYTFVWKVVTDETDSVDVQFNLTPDAGIDFTYFMIDNGDAPEVKEAQPIGYIYDGDLDSDFAYIYLSGSEAFSLTEINASETVATADSLQKFQAVVISPTVAADNAYLSTIKQAVAYVPVLNLNPNLYEALGYGSAVKTDATSLTIVDAENPAFEGLDIEEGLALLTDGGITGVTLGDYFADDAIVALAGETVAMHMHNAKRNAYMLLPLTLEDMAVADQDIISTLIPQALQVVADTKKEVTAVGTPVITPKQLNGETLVSISAANSSAIYYTLDGTDPTTSSTVYTEPFTLYQNATVKAIATGDGYTDSKIAEKNIVIMTQASRPQIDVQREQGKSTVTLSAFEDGVNIYFNFTGNQLTTTDAQQYTEPIELTDEPATIYAFAMGGDYLQSETAQQFIGIDGINANTIRTDTVAHFSATWATWNIDTATDNVWGIDAWSNTSSANYLLGKSAWTYYSDELDHEEEGTDEEGNPTTIYIYKPNPDAVRELTNDADPEWKLKSQGQVMTLENLTVEEGIGGNDGSTNGRGSRYSEWAVDQIGGLPTRGAITFGGKTSGEPFTARIESTVKFQGPFDVVVYAGNGNSSPIDSKPVHEVQVSTDGENWTAIGNLKFADTRRYIKKTRLHYEGTDEVYVRNAQISGGSSGQVYDIYILNNGPVSQQYTDDGAGISTQTAGVVVRTEVFTLGGVRMSQTGRGIQLIRKTYSDGTVRTEKVLR